MSQRPAKKTGPIGLFWTDYGGARALVKSPYLQFSGLIALVLTPAWWREGWWDTVISITPSVLGFSLAAYAMLIAFGNDKFLSIITAPIEGSSEIGTSKGKVRKPSVYATTSAAFVHFIIVQTTALLLAIFFKAWYLPIPAWFKDLLNAAGILPTHFIQATRLLWFVGFWLFLYSVACGLAATLRVYMMTRWYAILVQRSSQVDQDKASSDPKTDRG